MSSAANHRARSHRSQGVHASAMHGVKRRSIVDATHREGVAGAPLIYRLRAFRRRIAELRHKRESERGAENDA